MATSGRKQTGHEIEAVMGNLKLKAPRVHNPSHEQIAQRAYERWEHGGRQPGMTELNWIRAEEEFTGADL